MSEAPEKYTAADPHGQTPPKSTVAIDKDLQEFRDLLEVPTEFSNGLTWPVICGAIFCGVIMFPGSIYLWLVAGAGMGGAATWVTLIVFSEITRRAMRSLSKQEMVVLLMLSNAMIMGNVLIQVPGGPFGELIWRQYMVTSDAAQNAGIYEFPEWWAPGADSQALAERTFFHRDWAVPIALLLFTVVIAFVNDWTLGYGLYRLLSDVERLPFPLAPVGAQGATALAEGEADDKTYRWTVFSIGTMVGLAFGMIYLGVPLISSVFLEKPLMILPLPWMELSTTTENILPAVPTGVTFDLAALLIGMIIPFWAALGTFLSVAMMFILNPILHGAGVLTTWQPGMQTVDILISNQIDFYFSVVIGLLVGVTLISIFQTIKQMVRLQMERRRLRREMHNQGQLASVWATPPGRGDWSITLCVVGYFIASTVLMLVCKWLVPDFPWWFLAMLVYFYTPLITYLNARIKGMAGQHIEVPLIREAIVLVSGARGIAPWLAPIPKWDYSRIPNELRTLELTGTKVSSLFKSWAFATPALFILSFAFWSFLWKDAPIPGQMYPAARQLMDFQAKQKAILWSATTGEKGSATLFSRAFKMDYAVGGLAFAIGSYAVLALFGLPTILLFGLARGYAVIPHFIMLEFFGALIARFVLYKKFGKQKFLRAMPIVVAGVAVGTGLVGMGCVALKLIQSAISQSPF